MHGIWAINHLLVGDCHYGKDNIEVARSSSDCSYSLTYSHLTPLTGLSLLEYRVSNVVCRL
jgi:hypothetical protein